MKSLFLYNIRILSIISNLFRNGYTGIQIYSIIISNYPIKIYIYLNTIPEIYILTSTLHFLYLKLEYN